MQRDQQSLQMPGELVDVDGGVWRLDCAGQGEPTVLLEAGLGEPGLTWADLQPTLENNGRVCSYDRAGYGWSAPGQGSRDAGREATELQQLLHAAGVRGPYVMVAHSLGSFVSRIYAARYPDDIVALVLVDPTNEDSALAAGEPTIPVFVAHGQAVLSRVGVLRPFISGLVSDQVGATPPTTVTAEAPFLYRASAIDTSAAELSASLVSARQVVDEPILDRSLPVTVILTRQSLADATHFEVLTDATRIVDAGESSHYVHYSHPELVLAAIAASKDP